MRVAVIVQMVVVDAVVVMEMDVLASDRRIVRVEVMAIVVAMRVRVLDRCVVMAVAMLLRQVQPHPEPEQGDRR
ncbi:MAG: hypothetical protein ABI678_32765, partial [Kofleriaceae bacterium]